MTKNKTIRFPNYACGCPVIKATNSTILDNILSYSDNVVMASATIPKDLEDKIVQKANEYEYGMSKFNIDSVPFTFNVAILKLSDKLSLEKQKKLVAEIVNRKTCVFWVEHSKKSAESTYEQIKSDTFFMNKVTYFEGQDYKSSTENIEFKQTGLENTKEIILTYAKSAICKANDLPHINFVMVDCSLFLPSVALNFGDNVDVLEQRKIQMDLIYNELTQIIGRVFRSLEARKADVTVVDPRQIVILLHNLPYELHGFQPDAKILNTYNEFSDEHITGLTERAEVQCIKDSILKALNGEPVTDKAGIQRQRAIEKAKAEGLSKLDRRTEREILREEDVLEIKQCKNSKI